MRRQAFKCRLLGAGWWRLWGWWGARGLGQTPALKSKSESTTRHFKRMQNASKQWDLRASSCYGLQSDTWDGEWEGAGLSAILLQCERDLAQPKPLERGRKWISGNVNHELLVCRCLLGQPSRKVCCVNFQCIKFIRRALPVWTLRKIRSEIQKFSRFISTKEYQCNYKKRK